MTAQQLAEILAEEFENDDWEEVFTRHLRKVAEGKSDGVTEELFPVLEKIVAKITALVQK